MSPGERHVTVNGIELAYFEWGRKQRGRTSLLLAHATGFHARCWDQIIRRLDGRHIVAVDQRGHGRSGGSLPLHWSAFGADLAAFVGALDLHDLVGLGHSMGGHALAEAAALAPARFVRLLLIDPVIVAPELYNTPGTWTGRLEGQHPTAKRRKHWSSWQEMFERFTGRSPFDTWDRAVLQDYCRFGLLPATNGEGFLLACDPQFEAEVYMTSRGNGAIYDRVRAVEVPVLVVRAMPPPPNRGVMDFRYSPTWPGLASRFSNGEDLHLPERSHFLPMEAPAFTAELIRREIER